MEEKDEIEQKKFKIIKSYNIDSISNYSDRATYISRSYNSNIDRG